MTGKASSSRAHSQRATQHIRLPCLHDAYEHSFILTMPSSLAPLRLYAGRYAVASRFERQPCGCGIHCSRASDGLLPLRLYLVGYVRWDARSNPVHLLLDNRYQQLQLYSSQRSVDSKETGREDSAPKSFLSSDADVFRAAEGSIRQRPLMRGRAGIGGVPSPGHVPQRLAGNSRELPISSHTTRTASGLGREVRATEGRPEEARRDG